MPLLLAELYPENLRHALTSIPLTLIGLKIEERKEGGKKKERKRNKNKISKNIIA